MCRGSTEADTRLTLAHLANPGCGEHAGWFPGGPGVNHSPPGHEAMEKHPAYHLSMQPASCSGGRGRTEPTASTAFHKNVFAQKLSPQEKSVPFVSTRLCPVIQPQEALQAGLAPEQAGPGSKGQRGPPACHLAGALALSPGPPPSPPCATWRLTVLRCGPTPTEPRGPGPTSLQG